MPLTLPVSITRTYRIAVSGFFFIAGFVFASWASRIPDIKNHLHLSDAGLGSVLLALPAGLMTGLPLAGYLVSRYGSKKIMIAGAFLYPAILLLLGLAATTWQLTAALFMFGFCGNCSKSAAACRRKLIKKKYFEVNDSFLNINNYLSVSF